MNQSPGRYHSDRWQPWAIWPVYLETLLNGVSKETYHEIEALTPSTPALGQGLSASATLEIRDNVAILPIQNVILPRTHRLSEYLGATILDQLMQDFKVALHHPSVQAILLAIDSPGGAVTGINECADAFYAARGQKPIIAYVSGIGASAAYWLASSADEIVLDATASVGSIGVVCGYTDDSERQAKEGIRKVQLVNRLSPRKCLDVTSEEGRAEIQTFLDQIAAVFVQKVARHRKVTRGTVLTKFGQGGLLVGQEAVSQGLADRLGAFETLLAELQGRFSSHTSSGGFFMTPNAVTEAPMNNIPIVSPTPLVDAAVPQGAPLTLQTLTAQYPGLADELREEGAQKERERIQGVENQGMKGHEALIQRLKFDGKTTGSEAAMQVLAAEKALRDHQLTTFYAEAPAPLPPFIEAKEGGHQVTQPTFTPEAFAHEWQQDATLRAEFPNQAGYVAYRKAKQQGLVMPLSPKVSQA